MASLTCSDASSWSSSSDITEPVSPASPSSSSSQIASPVNQAASSAAGQESSPTPQEIFPSPHDADDDDAAGIKRRRRRYSDSTASACGVVVDSRSKRGKRTRRMSAGSAGSTHPQVPEWPLSPSKWYSCLWRSKDWICTIAVPNQDDDDEDLSAAGGCLLTMRQSWPLAKRTGQLKITEFFSTQVKGQWNYQVKQNSSNTRAAAQDRLSPAPATLINDAPACQQSHMTPAHHDSASSSSAAQTPSMPAAPPSSPSSVASSAIQNPEQRIRFPVDQSSSSGKSDTCSSSVDVQCLWKNCGVNLSMGQSLLEHIHSVHVASQAGAKSGKCAAAAAAAGNERYVCQWEGCKVQGRCSSSRAWLERHVLTHGGNKPFLCIVESCEQRFNSQVSSMFTLPRTMFHVQISVSSSSRVAVASVPCSHCHGQCSMFR